MTEIWVIGTDPPCPRCALMTRRVEAVMEELGLEAKLRHLSYSDPIAQQFAESLGQEVGTAKDVARVSGAEMDMDRISGIIAQQWTSAAKRLDCSLEDVPPADRWSPELDEALRPYEEEAIRTGFLMTPVLVVNDEVKHQGSVPTIDQIKDAIGALQSTQSHRDT